MAWTPIWRQAMACALGKGKLIGKEKTICYSVKPYASGDRMRVRFRNDLGDVSYQIGAMAIIANNKIYEITHEDKTSFEIPTGGVRYSDEIVVPVAAGESIEIRMFFKNYIADNNITEEQANLIKGDITHDLLHNYALKKSFLVKLAGAYNGVPAIEAIELWSEQPTKQIVAFGDSITAMSRWTKPLAERLYMKYGSEFQLLNAGINGNCLLYTANGPFSETFGQKGVDRFDRDVLGTEGLSVVIFALGVNDVAQLNKKTKDIVNFDHFTKELTKVAEQLHARDVRIVVQTITPRLGCNGVMGRFTQEMEELRLQINEWIRSCGLFDYVMDAEAVLSVDKKDGLYVDDRWHQGDHLHPNAQGGQLMADAYDLEKLTGKG